MHYAVHDDSEVNPVPIHRYKNQTGDEPQTQETQVPTARRPLNRLSVAFRLNPPPRLRSSHFFRFLEDFPGPQQRARRAEKERGRRAAESPASRQARLALVKAATRRRSQALTLEFDITAKRRNSEKKRERRAAESPASRQARLALVKAATRRRR